MPELPEVETTIRDLKTKVLGRTFVDVWSDAKKLIKKPNSFSIFKKKLKNQKIKNIHRRGKNIILELSNDLSLLIHQKMTGHLLYGEWEKQQGKWVPKKKGPLSDKDNSYLHVIFFLDNRKMIALSNLRKFAKVELWKSKNLKKQLKNLGPEPLSKNFTLNEFKETLKGRRAGIKKTLMNQKVIAGIGNIYSDETLWEAKIHPETSTANLTPDQLQKLYQAIKKVLKKGVCLGGESISDYRRPSGKRGDYDRARKVYRKEGEKCPRCGAKIKRIKVGQRSAHFCPICQKQDKSKT